ncbi:MAG: cation transporter [Gammaproteobacteria bacterium]|nr:cation transporter [Gammaproteobacteria bacterium]
MHSHSHDHGDHKHNLTQNVLIISMILAFVFAGIEGVAGWWSQSLALLSDAGHMFSDALALALAAFAAWVAKKPPSTQHSYGLGRAEILGAWASSLLVLAVAIFVVVEAIQRLHAPQPVSGGVVMLVAFLGVVVNIGIAWILTHGEQSLNVRAAVLHVMGDLLGSVAALISGAVIYFTHWTPIDPILSIFISVLIVVSSFRLLKESLVILMEGVPLHLDINTIGKAMASIDKVRSVHDLHIWTLSSGVIVLTAHVEIDEFHQWNDILHTLRSMLIKEYKIEHVTLQPETHTHVIYHMPSRPI